MGVVTIRKRGGKKGKRSARHAADGRYVKRRAITEANRQRKRRKHAKLHPNDKQAL